MTKQHVSMKRSSKGKTKKPDTSDKRLYTLDVFIISGPMVGKVSRKKRAISRTIQIRSDQTLAQLHQAIFDAFDRFDEHMYEFQIGGKGPMDPQAKAYVLPMAMNDPFSDSKPAGNVIHTTIGSLDLKINEAFAYWFDFGDDWWHQINVVDIKEKVPKGKYPKVTKRVGESPPQYVD